jgi:MYXO-CTERM domain-containing protein
MSFATSAGIAGSVARASALYDSGGFESFTNGTLDGQHGWSVIKGATDDTVIQGTTTHAMSGKAVQLKDAATADSFQDLAGQYKNTTIGSQNHWVDVWLKAPTAAELDGNNSYLRLRNGSTIEATLNFHEDGSGLSGFNAGEWNRFTLYVQPLASKMDVYVNGESNGSIAFADTNITINRYDFGWRAAAGTNGDGMFADDFRITTDNPLPEPAGLGLLAAGGMLLMRRRRK